jgi:hypothetical protein
MRLLGFQLACRHSDIRKSVDDFGSPKSIAQLPVPVATSKTLCRPPAISSIGATWSFPSRARSIRLCWMSRNIINESYPTRHGCNRHVFTESFLFCLYSRLITVAYHIERKDLTSSFGSRYSTLVRSISW